MPKDEFDVLDVLFASVDDYVCDSDLRERTDGIDDAEMRSQASKAYERLFRQ